MPLINMENVSPILFLINKELINKNHVTLFRMHF